MIRMDSNTVLEVGSRVYSGLYGGRAGVVYAIHGEQNIGAQPRRVGPLVVVSGNCYFDIVFENGTLSRHLPECILKGVQWYALEGRANQQEIDELLAFNKTEDARKAREVAEEKTAFNARVEALKIDPEFKHLTQGNDYSGTLAAKNIRAQLKKSFPGVKFSVRKRSYGCLNISWTDGPTVAQVEELTSRYDVGRFDSMQDLATTERAPFDTVFGGAQYIFTERDYSAELAEIGLAEVWKFYGGNLRGVQRPTGAEYVAGACNSVYLDGLGEWLPTLVRRELVKIAA